LEITCLKQTKSIYIIEFLDVKGFELFSAHDLILVCLHPRQVTRIIGIETLEGLDNRTLIIFLVLNLNYEKLNKMVTYKLPIKFLVLEALVNLKTFVNVVGHLSELIVKKECPQRVKIRPCNRTPRFFDCCCMWEKRLTGSLSTSGNFSVDCVELVVGFFEWR
jgi:hypothetical protein